MIIEQRKLWPNDVGNRALYTMYLQDNSDEIEAGRRHPAMIVCGGGGYLGISDREKEPVALYYLNEGYQTFVLDYTTAKVGNSTYPFPVFDLAKMILTVRENANEWNIHPNKIAIIGFSAGAHLCACAATQWQEEYLSEKLGVPSELLKPDVAILAYPLTDFHIQNEWAVEREDADSPSLNSLIGVSREQFMQMANEAMLGKEYTEAMAVLASPINHITSHVPPVFLWHTRQDEMVYVLNSLKFAEKLVEAGIDCELHMFERGPHGMSLANRQSGGGDGMMDDDAGLWKELSVRFLKRHFDIGK